MKYNIENRSGLYVNGVAYPDGLWVGGGYRAEYVDPVINITKSPYDEIDKVIYDDSNIFIEFNELVGTSTDSNVLVATAYDGYGIADDVTGTEYIGLSNISAEFEFESIAMDILTVADTLVTSSPIKDGDNLVIVKEDESIHELIASGVTEKTVDPDGSTNPTTDRYELWDNIVEFVPENGTSVYKSGSVYSTFWTPGLNQAKGIVFDIPLVINKCFIQRTTAGARRMPSSGDVEASHDGVTWVTLHSYASGNVASHMAVFNNGIAYRHYRLKCTANRSDDGYGTIDFIKAHGEPASMDTRAVTQGEIPSKVYTVDAQPSFSIGGDYVDAVKESDDYVYDFDPDGANNPSTTDAIPNMTSATAPYGVVTSKNNAHTSYPEWKSANGDASGSLNRWLGSVAGGNWWGYEFLNPTIINKYIINIIASDTRYACKDWTFLGSNTGAFAGEEVILDTQVGQSNWNGARVFTFINGTAYKYYRMDITANNGAPDFYLIGEVAFIASDVSMRTTRKYEDRIEDIGSTTISPKVTLKSIGDKMTKMKFTTLKDRV